MFATYQDSLSCLETLVGLAQNNCPCNTTGRPVNYNESLSGLYMDDYEHGLADVFSKSAVACGDGSMWDVAAKARYEGIGDFATYLFKAIGENKNKFVDGFAGEFGEVNKRQVNTSDKSCTKSIAGFVFKPNVYNGAQIKLKKIWLAIDLPGNYTIDVHDLTNFTTPVASVIIAHPGGSQLVGVEVDLADRLQPLSEAGKPISYSVSYTRNGGLPLNYTYHCGCGASNHPMWVRNKYMEAQGFCVNNLSEIIPGNVCCNRQYSGGLIVEWEIICDPATWICSQDTSFWKSSHWGRIAAKAAQIIITQKLISAILDTARVNFYTMISADALYEKKKNLATLTDELITYLSSHMPEHASHCWRCTTSQGFSKRSIIV